MIYSNFTKDTFLFHHTLDIAPLQSDYKMHTHEDYEVYIFLSGNGKYIIEGNEYNLSPGDVIITRGSESHYLKLTGNDPYERIVIQFAKEDIASFDEKGLFLEPFENRSLGEYNCYNVFSLDKYVLDNIINRILTDEQDEAKSGYEFELSIKLCLFSLLYEVRNSFLKEDHLPIGKSNSSITEIVSYINSHITDTWTIKDLCDHFYISKSYLTNKFKQLTGSTIWEYVTVKRLILARKMIKNGFSTSEILNECGFNDYSTFYRR